MGMKYYPFVHGDLTFFLGFELIFEMFGFVMTLVIVGVGHVSLF